MASWTKLILEAKAKDEVDSGGDDKSQAATAEEEDDWGSDDENDDTNAVSAENEAPTRTILVPRKLKQQQQQQHQQPPPAAWIKGPPTDWLLTIHADRVREQQIRYRIKQAYELRKNNRTVKKTALQHRHRGWPPKPSCRPD